MNAIKYALLGLYGVIGLLLSTFGLFRMPFAESLARQHYRYAIGGVLILLLILPIVIGVFILSFNANNFKTEIVQYVKAHTQRDLVLQGDIKVTFFPKLGLDSGKMSLSQRNSAREFASVNNARFYIAWLPLLRKQLVFDHVEIDGARVNLIRFKDGTANYDDLLIRNDRLAPVTFDIDSVHITHSSLNWQDEMKWQRVALQDVQIETGRLADTVPSNLKASFHLDSEKARSDAMIELKSRLFYDRKEGRYEFADIEGKLHGTVSRFSNLDLDFNGDIDSHSLPDPSGQESLLAENIIVSATGNYGQRNIVARLGVPKLQFAKDSWNGSDLTLEATLSQFDEKWTTTMQMPAFEFANQVFNTAQLTADFDFKGDGRMLQGKLTSPLNVDFDTRRNVLLSAVTVDLSATHPMLSGQLTAKVTGNMQADLDGQNANVEFNARIDDSKLNGKFALQDFDRPAYTFDLNIDRLPLDRYIAADWIKRYQDDATPVDLGGIKEMNLRGSLHAGKISTAKFEADKLAADIKIEQSTLTIEPLAARLYGGTLTGSISAAAQAAPQITFKQNLKGVQVNALLAATTAAGRISGKGDVALDFSAEGASIGTLRRALNGSASLTLTHGSLAGIDLRAALIEGRDELGVASGMRTHETLFSEKTDFSELKAIFNAADGISHGNSFDMRSSLIKIAGAGDIVPDTGSIDYRLVATVSSALNKRSAGELAEIKGVAVPVRVSGPYATPTIELDFAGASGDIVTKRIAARAALQQAAAKAATEQMMAATPVAKTAIDKSPVPVRKKLPKAIKK